MFVVVSLIIRVFTNCPYANDCVICEKGKESKQMQMVQWEGGKSVNDEDCGGKEWCIVVRREKKKCVFVHRYVCVCVYVLLLVYLTRVLL